MSRFTDIFNKDKDIYKPKELVFIKANEIRDGDDWNRLEKFGFKCGYPYLDRAAFSNNDEEFSTYILTNSNFSKMYGYISIGVGSILMSHKGKAVQEVSNVVYGDGCVGAYYLKNLAVDNEFRYKNLTADFRDLLLRNGAQTLGTLLMKYVFDTVKEARNIINTKYVMLMSTKTGRSTYLAFGFKFLNIEDAISYIEQGKLTVDPTQLTLNTNLNISLVTYGSEVGCAPMVIMLDI